MASQKITLSKDLPGGRVTVPAGSEKKNYYKYFLEPFEDIPEEQKRALRASRGSLADTLEPEDRKKLQDAKCYPAKSGVYPLKHGGLLAASNVPAPHIKGETIGWWATWHTLDHLRYAIWDPADHYGIEIRAEDRERALDSKIPVGERLWGMHHKVLESLDGDTPSVLTMTFLNPADAGYDMSLLGTDRCEYILCANAKLGGVIPVFMTENFCRGGNGENEVRLRFWIGYKLVNGKVKCKLPFFIKPPVDMVANLIVHNFREYKHLDKLLPAIYAEQKDNWIE